MRSKKNGEMEKKGRGDRNSYDGFLPRYVPRKKWGGGQEPVTTDGGKVPWFGKKGKKRMQRYVENRKRGWDGGGL